MWDGWQAAFDCTRSEQATLAGFRREFNKASVRNWGSQHTPGPTLGLAPDDGAQCVGLAFECPDSERNRLVEALSVREGSSFTLKEKEIELQSGGRVVALAPVNTRSGNTYIGDRSVEERARLARAARGTSGCCFDYVKNVRARLAELGIRDSGIEKFWTEVSKV